MSSVVRMPMPESPLPAPLPRRVLVLGQQLVSDCMEWHVLDSLRALGCEAEFCALRPPSVGYVPLDRALAKLSQTLLREPERRVERRLLATIERFAPDFVLVLLGNALSPKTVDRLRARTTAPIVCWCQDQMTTLGRQYLLGAGYDAAFVKDRYMLDVFGRMVRSTPFHYLAEACNPRVHRTLPLSADDERRHGCDVMIAGTLYYYRQEILRGLDEFDLRIHGARPAWLVDRLPHRRIHPEVFGDDKVRAVRAARVALNTLHYAEVDGLNARAFELAGIGGFQLIDHKAVLAEHFRIGEEIETWRTPDELRRKIRHYLANRAEAAAIADAGQRRAHREHTYEARLRVLFACVGFVREAVP